MVKSQVLVGYSIISSPKDRLFGKKKEKVDYTKEYEN